MDYKIRLERKDDWFKVEKLTRKAFWKEEDFLKKGIGCDEHYLAHLLRKSNFFVPELDFVVELNSQIIGNIIYTKAYVKNEQKQQEVLCFGPVSILPEFQNKGIGSDLIRYSIEKAKQLDYSAIIIYGHPNYYPRFGFVNAEKFDITTVDSKNFPAFMVLELQKDALSSVSGKFYLAPEFEINQSEAKKFDKKFDKD